MATKKETNNIRIMKKHRADFNIEKYKKAKKLRKNRYKLREIAKEMGVTTGRIWALLKRGDDLTN